MGAENSLRVETARPTRNFVFCFAQFVSFSNIGSFPFILIGPQEKETHN
jgi:hypothetical protein